MASKNKPHEVVSGAGWLVQIAGGMISGLEECELSKEQIHRLGTPSGVDDLQRGIKALCAELAGPVAPSYDPETRIYRFEDNYDESIIVKTTDQDPKSLAQVTDYATDIKFPDNRTGQFVRTGRIIKFYDYKVLKRWVKENEKVLAGPKELLDFSNAFPHPALDEHMPLVAAGQSWGYPLESKRCYLCLRHVNAKRGLFHIWLWPHRQIDDDLWALVLDKQTP